jgi:enoyl-CoA hydratase/carnithine racemase
VPLARIRRIPKPVIAAINGGCAGIGLTLALHCDLRFAASDAKLTTAFARLGLVAEQGMSHLLPRLVGPSTALDLLWSARVVTGEEALRLGLVDRAWPADELMARTRAYARELAGRPPSALAVIKWQVHRHVDLDLARATAESDELASRALAGRDFRTALAIDGAGPFPPVAGDALDERVPLELLVPARDDGSDGRLGG